MDQSDPARAATYNPWSIVNLVFQHLTEQGLQPVLGAADPGEPAAALLRAMGVEPVAEGNRKVSEGIRQRLAEMRGVMFGDDSVAGP